MRLVVVPKLQCVLSLVLTLGTACAGESLQPVTSRDPAPDAGEADPNLAPRPVAPLPEDDPRAYPQPVPPPASGAGDDAGQPSSDDAGESPQAGEDPQPEPQPQPQPEPEPEPNPEPQPEPEPEPQPEPEPEPQPEPEPVPAPDPDPQPTPVGKAAALAEYLRGKPHFLFGLRNDGAVSLGTGLPLDLHYQYLVGDWQRWNTDATGEGAYVTRFANEAQAHGMTPMLTLYQMADRGDGAISAMAEDAFMSSYWRRVRLMFQRLGSFNRPAVVQIEPDFWGYAFQRGMRDGTATAKVRAHVPECASLPDTLAGMGRCFFRLRDALAPKVVVGMHVTNWGFSIPQLISFFEAVGAELGDFITIETLDRDAGCFEARRDSNCQRSGSFYWDETNRTTPNFHQHFAWVRQVSQGLDLPVIWWQTPLGVPSTTPGGTQGHYRDNRVRYFFAHVDELVEAGGVGVVFGSGTTPATQQTTLSSDGGQFVRAAGAYYAEPVTLP